MPRVDQTGASTTSIPRVNIGWIHPFLEILEEAGVPYGEILEQANLPTLAIDDATLQVPTAKIYDFVALATQRTGMTDLGLQAGIRLDLESLLPGAERTWARSGAFRSLESFLDIALRSSSNVDIWIESNLESDGHIEFFYLGTFGPDHPAFTSVEQYMVALMIRWTRYGAGPKWNPAVVNFRATSVPRAAVQRLAGDAQIQRGQSVTSIVFPSQRFVGPMEGFPEEGSAIWRRHRRALEKADTLEDLAGSLRLVLRAYLPDGSPDIKQAAQLTGTSVRTLQRRLKDQGLSYSQLLAGLRHDLAIYLLRDADRYVSEISRELGYRDPAIFTRAFRRWTGVSPLEFRRSLL